MRVWIWILLLGLTTTVWGAGWRQWRGPALNGTSEETGLVDELSPTTLLWQQPLSGLSAATPVIADGKLYLLSSSANGKEVVGLCFDAAGGTLLWERTLTETATRFGQGNTCASCSPCVDDSGVVFYCGDGTLVKFDTTGEQLWKRNLTDEYGPFTVKFGYSSSPLLVEGTLYIMVLRFPDDKKTKSTNLESFLTGIDAATGKTVFYQVRETGATGETTNAYTSPMTATIDGKQQILMYGADYLTSHDPATGKELWRCKTTETPSPSKWGRAVSTPAVEGEMIYCSYQEGYKAMAYNLADLAAGTCQRVWTYDQQVSDAPCPTVVDGSVYILDERDKKLICLDAATGKEQWAGQLDKSDQYYASITATDGKLYLVNRRGVVSVVAADPTAFRIISTHDFGGRPADSTISVADGRLYLRTAEILYCFGNKN